MSDWECIRLIVYAWVLINYHPALAFRQPLHWLVKRHAKVLRLRDLKSLPEREYSVQNLLVQLLKLLSIQIVIWPILVLVLVFFLVQLIYLVLIILFLFLTTGLVLNEVLDFLYLVQNLVQVSKRAVPPLRSKGTLYLVFDLISVTLRLVRIRARVVRKCAVITIDNWLVWLLRAAAFSVVFVLVSNLNWVL